VDLIYDTKCQIETALFSNKTMLFLIKKEIGDDRKTFCITKEPDYSHQSINLFYKLDETCVGILLFITNEYCGPDATKIFRR
jgi:hypothetical protein